MEQLDLIVIGAGISGVALAARAAAAGLSVVVVEQHATVAQGASFSHSGMVVPSPLDPWFGPGPVAPAVGGPPWGRKARLQAADDARRAAYATLAPLVAASRAALMETMATTLATSPQLADTPPSIGASDETVAIGAAAGIDYEARNGVLYLFRTPQALAQASALCSAFGKTANAAADQAASNAATGTATRTAPTLSVESSDDSDALEGAGEAAPGDDAVVPAFAYRVLDADACRIIEPALAHIEDVAGAIWLEDLWSGNCALAAKRLRAAPVCENVEFLLARRAVGVRIDSDRVFVDIQPATEAAGAFVGVQAKGFVTPSPEPLLRQAGHGRGSGPTTQRLTAKRVAIAAGSGTSTLLASAGVSLPLLQVHSPSVTGLIVREEFAPRHTLVDAERGVGIVRFEQRLRASLAVLSKSHRDLPAKQLDRLTQTLHECADHRVPGAARLNADGGTGDHAAAADGLPIIGALPMVRAHNHGGKANTARRRATASSAPPIETMHAGWDAHADRLFLSLPGTHRGWGLAFGAADIIVERITGRPLAMDRTSHHDRDAEAESRPSWQAFSPTRFR